MRGLLLFICLNLIAVVSFSQDSTDQNTDRYFIILYSIGENWDTTKQAHEQLYFSEHSAHLSGLRKSGEITIGARFSEKGMIILSAKNEAEAKILTTKDPAIQNKVFKAEIHPFHPFYSGCLE